MYAMRKFFFVNGFTFVSVYQIIYSSYFSDMHSFNCAEIFCLFTIYFAQTIPYPKKREDITIIEKGGGGVPIYSVDCFIRGHSHIDFGFR